MTLQFKMIIALPAFISAGVLLSGCAMIAADPQTKAQIENTGKQIVRDTVGAVVEVGVGQAKRAGKEARRIPKNIKKLEK